MTTKFRKLMLGESSPSDEKIYDIRDCDIDLNVFQPVCANKNCGCKLTEITRTTQNGYTRYLMSNSHAPNCIYSTSGNGIKTYNLSEESFVDTVNMFSDKKSKKGVSAGTKNSVETKENNKETNGYSAIEYTNKPKPCKVMDDFIFSLYDMKDSDIIKIKDMNGNLLKITKKDFIVSKKNNENYDGKDLSGLKLIIDVRKQNEFILSFVKGTYFMVLQTSLDGKTTIDKYGKKIFHSKYQPVYIKFVFSTWELMQEFKKLFNQRNENAIQKSKPYNVPAIYCNLEPIEVEDVKGVTRQIYEAKVYDKSITWIDKNSLELL